MRSEFQDVFKDAYDHWIDDACSHRYNASKSLALQVWKHQQSKIDELQKQVDESLRILVDIKKKGLIGTQYSIFDLEQSLKGGSDE